MLYMHVQLWTINLQLLAIFRIGSRRYFGIHKFDPTLRVKKNIKGMLRVLMYIIKFNHWKIFNTTQHTR